LDLCTFKQRVQNPSLQSSQSITAASVLYLLEQGLHKLIDILTLKCKNKSTSNLRQ
jgi:hypothetical protein